MSRTHAQTHDGEWLLGGESAIATTTVKRHPKIYQMDWHSEHIDRDGATLVCHHWTIPGSKGNIFLSPSFLITFV